MHGLMTRAEQIAHNENLRADRLQRDADTATVREFLEYTRFTLAIRERAGDALGAFDRLCASHGIVATPLAPEGWRVAETSVEDVPEHGRGQF